MAWGQTNSPATPAARTVVPDHPNSSASSAFNIPMGAMLSREWQEGMNPAPYLVSEKLDGVRALWDGKTLRFRSGRTIAAPSWFLAGLPAVPLDGELWIARRQFDVVSATVRRTSAVDAEWRQVRYRVFDLPADSRTFAQRAAAIEVIVQKAEVPWLQGVEQMRVADDQSLQRHLLAVTAKGGEGLVLHHEDAVWRPGRNDGVRKLKTTPDEEAQVVAHIPGKGKLKGLMGALLLEMPDGKRFALGTGFSDALRHNPPVVGSTITYRFRDRTATGLPRFASFLRMHAPE
jgi:DNA ligase-1